MSVPGTPEVTTNKANLTLSQKSFQYSILKAVKRDQQSTLDYAKWRND